MKKNIMKKAWDIRRAAAEKYNCKVADIFFSACLKQAWAEAKAGNESAQALRYFCPKYVNPEMPGHSRNIFEFVSEKDGLVMGRGCVDGKTIGFFNDVIKYIEINSVLSANILAAKVARRQPIASTAMPQAHTILMD